MKKRLLALGATLAVFASGCESEQKDVCNSTANISENIQCDVEDVITDIDTDNDERHPRDDRPPRGSRRSDDVLDNDEVTENDTNEDFDLIEDNEIIGEDITEDTDPIINDTFEGEDTNDAPDIEYPIDDSAKDDCYTDNADLLHQIRAYDNTFSMSFREIIHGEEHNLNLLDRYNLDIYFKTRIERGLPRYRYNTMAVSGSGLNDGLLQLVAGTYAVHERTGERLTPRVIMLGYNSNSRLTTMEFSEYDINSPEYTIYKVDYRYIPGTDEISGCSAEWIYPNSLESPTRVENICIDDCDTTLEDMPRFFKRFFESEYSQPVE